jgi:hypothetical protein
MTKKNLLSFILVFSLSVISLLHFSGTGMLKKEGTSHWLGADVALATWIFERAQIKDTIKEFYTECRWSEKGCFRYDSVPMEWPFLYKLGRFGKMMGYDAMETMDLWFLITFVLNCVFVYFSLLILTKDQWGSALCSLPIIFQYSLAQKVAWGHIVLTFISPIIFSLALCYFALESVKNKKKIHLLTSVSFGLCTFLTLYTSYYYTAFSFLLHGSLILIFFVMHRVYVNRHFLVNVGKAVVVPAFIGGLMSLLLNTHIFRGADGVLDGDIHNRKPIGISLYSARPTDFIKPLPDTVLGKLFSKFNISFADHSIRGEVYSYQGTAVLLALVILFFMILRTDLKAKIKGFFKSKSKESFFLIMACVALFFATRNGGYTVYYTLTKSLRSFSRMAPFATFFLVAFIILRVNRKFSLKLRSVFYAVFFIVSLYESYTSEALNNLRNYTTSPLKQKVDEIVEKSHEQISRLCSNGYLEISPSFNESFLNGQWVPQYFLERHNCYAINGSYLEQFKNPNHFAGKALVLTIIEN